MTGKDWTGRLAFFSAGVLASVVALVAAPTFVTSGSVNAVQSELRFVHADQAAQSSSVFDTTYLHLSRNESDVGPIASELERGDRITVGDRDGLKSVLEVIGLRKVALALGDDKKTKLTVVLARDVERPDRRPVRLIFESGELAGASGGQTIKPRAL